MTQRDVPGDEINTVRPVSGVAPARGPESVPPIASESSSAPPFAVGSSSAPPEIRGRRYETLDGGQGREVFFRPQRYAQSELGPVRPVVRITLPGGDVQTCNLRDVSQNGVAVEWPDDTVADLGAILENVTVTFDDHEAYRGAARVGSIRAIDGKQIVGVSFIDSLMNVDDVLLLRDVKSWMGQGATGLGLKGLPWQVEGHDRFKGLVGELRVFFEDATKQLAAMEASLPAAVIDDADSPARAALVERIQREFVDEFVRYSEEIDRAARLASPEALRALKEYSHRLIQPYLLQAPSMQRALYKPLGYPGDYEVMKYMYENQFAGTSLFAKAMNLAILFTRPGQAVRYRKDMVKRRLGELLDARAGTGEPLRVLSIAAGPAQEVYELLRERETLPAPIEIYLFDQDKGALTYAYSRLKRMRRASWGDDVRIVYLHDSIKRLLRDPAIFQAHGLFDMIFSAGLFDYLEMPTAVTLTRNLAAYLAPRGALWVGNMVPTSPNRWFMEMHLDWFLIYRTRAEMMDMARLAAPDARVHIQDEPTGINPFVVLTRE